MDDAFNIVDEQNSVAALVAGDNITVSHTHEASAILQIRRFMAVCTVAGFLLAAALGFESLQTARAVDQMRTDRQAVEALRADRANILANQRLASCAYTKAFVSAFDAWAQSLETQEWTEIKAQHNVPFHTARIAAFNILFSNLNTLGSNACIAPQMTGQ